MEVSGINGATTAAVQNNSAEDELGKEQFLELLIAQLQNQDPLQPQDGTEFIAQLATFANLEQLTSMNQGIEELKTMQGHALEGQAMSLVGSTAVFEGDRLVVGESGSTDVQYMLGAGSENATMHVFDPAGREVATLPVPSETGLNTTTFDGFGLDDQRLAAGEYRFEVRATVDGEAVEATEYTLAKIDGVTFETGSPVLMAGDLRFDPAQVLRVLDD